MASLKYDADLKRHDSQLSCGFNRVLFTFSYENGMRSKGVDTLKFDGFRMERLGKGNVYLQHMWFVCK